ncbi:MAG TPA: hypothetical protein VGA20_07510 [Gemmatimonadales bacterium]
MPVIRRMLTLAAAAGALLGAPLKAQSDEDLLSRYRLTENAYAKYVQASRNMIAAWKADSTAFKDEEEEEDEGDDPTIADLAAQYDGHPATKRAITSAGMTTREFVTFTFSLFQAAAAAWLVKQRQGKLDNLPAGTPRENVLFYQQHEAELQRLTEEMQAILGEKNE